MRQLREENNVLDVKVPTPIIKTEFGIVTIVKKKGFEIGGFIMLRVIDNHSKNEECTDNHMSK